MGSLLPHLHRDWAHPCDICTGTGLAPVATSAPGPRSPLLPLLRRDWARSVRLRAQVLNCTVGDLLTVPLTAEQEVVVQYDSEAQVRFLLRSSARCVRVVDPSDIGVAGGV
jgi:hypothetical protein